ncbi:tetratricopeptide repeat protein [Ruminococcus sp. D55t1_190419_H1]|uniref:tetratricopeptide repeat protein n=1 Tax=Ruminococcus sp. D55t1_190419_H1 TaxID=2787130 RepID=UPI001899ED1F|nr:tetratricopeptide repeat protein [Ruminococcus sp. D55t1_190419_H1]
MKKMIFAGMMAAVLAAGGGVSVNAQALTMEELKESLALKIDTNGLSGEELMEKGLQYENGESIVQWYAMAKAYYEAAKEAGNEEADAALEGLDVLKKEIMDNSPDGQGDVFEFFRTGVTAGQEGDYEKAYAISYDDAFFFEDPLYRGIGNLGDLLRDGNGVEQDIEKAVSIYEFNAEVLGKGNGYTSLGLLYSAEDGTYPGIEHSTDKAMEYFLKSYQDESLEETDFKGPRYAADLFDEGYDHDDGTHENPDYVKAEEGYLVASEGNGRTFDGTACYKLGTYYEEGRDGIEQNDEKALEFYLKAVSDENVHGTMLGIPQTYLALGRFYENGIGVEANEKTAYEYYTKALEAADENLALENAAGNQVAQEVYDQAQEALNRLEAE